MLDTIAIVSVGGALNVLGQGSNMVIFAFRNITLMAALRMFWREGERDLSTFLKWNDHNLLFSSLFLSPTILAASLLLSTHHEGKTMQNVNTKDLLQAAFAGGVQMLCAFSSISPTGEVRRDLGSLSLFLILGWWPKGLPGSKERGSCQPHAWENGRLAYLPPIYRTPLIL